MMVENHNPDVLTCLANLSNDEVFTPPALANAMLDLLPQELFENPDTTFLDPACKSGVFLREIAKRLIKGLEPQMPDLQERLDHIFHKQLFGLAITELTSLLSRRGLYCSKTANGKFSVAKMATPEGNIHFTPIKHTWSNGRCIYCGAAQSEYDRDDMLESHAYQFIHCDVPSRHCETKTGLLRRASASRNDEEAQRHCKESPPHRHCEERSDEAIHSTTLQEILNMKFDVIISNPPYQLSDGGGTGTSATPLYNIFVENAKKLNPRYLTMIIPARWFAGGRGLDKFRDEMLRDRRIRVLCDYFDSKDIFAGIDLSGGICYFLWDRDNEGTCRVISKQSWGSNELTRELLEKGASTFVRFNEAVSIIRKTLSHSESSFEGIVSASKPFGLRANVKPFNEKKSGMVKLFCYPEDGYYPRSEIIKNETLIDKWKVLISKSYGERGSFPYLIIGKPFIAEPASICSETYLIIGGGLDTRKEAENIISYMKTRFFRFLVLQKKNTQNATSSVYSFVPLQDFSKPWTDEELYAKYNLTQEEIAFIESMIRPMC